MGETEIRKHERERAIQKEGGGDRSYTVYTVNSGSDMWKLNDFNLGG